MYNGFTPSVSKKVLDAIELATLTEFVKESPDNLYWQGRLEAKRQEMEIAADTEWLGAPRTPEQNRINSEKWDFTPIPSDMPIIDIDNIDEIPF